MHPDLPLQLRGRAGCSVAGGLCALREYSRTAVPGRRRSHTSRVGASTRVCLGGRVASHVRAALKSRELLHTLEGRGCTNGSEVLKASVSVAVSVGNSVWSRRITTANSDQPERVLNSTLGSAGASGVRGCILISCCGCDQGITLALCGIGLCARRDLVHLQHLRERLCTFLLLGSIGSLRDSHRVHLRKDVLRGGQTGVEGLALKELRLLHVHRSIKTFLNRGCRLPVRAHTPGVTCRPISAPTSGIGLKSVFLVTPTTGGSAPALPRPSPSSP